MGIRKVIRRALPFIPSAWQLRGTRAEVRREVFEKIYRENHWVDDESRSGVGSRLANVAAVRNRLPSLLRELGTVTFLDIPCGDFNWMKHVDLGGTSYIGGDIVEELVADNVAKYGSDRCEFRVIDIVTDTLPTADVLMCRDLFNHMPLADVMAAVKNVQRSNIKYILFATYSKVDENHDTAVGGNRWVNFQKAPFNFPEPLEVILEDWEGHKEYGRSVALWRVDQIPPNL